MERYKIQKVVGGGTYGTVYRGNNIKTGEVVAIKKMKKNFATWDECMSLREIKSLRKLNHPNIVKLKEVVKVNDELYLVFEFLEQNLYQLYQDAKEKGKGLSEAQIKSIIYHTASGLAYMHKHGFFHRDLKPENLMMARDMVKICDFGLAREIRSRPPFTDYVATRWYRAPEIILKSTNYNSPVDIFALGCIMAELYTLQPLFRGNSEIDQLFKIFGVLGTPSQSQWPEGYRLAKLAGINFPTFQPTPLQTMIPNASQEAIQLLGDMLRFEAEKRPNVSQILAHPYFQDMLPLTVENIMGTQSVEHVNFTNGNEQPVEDMNDALGRNRESFAQPKEQKLPTYAPRDPVQTMVKEPSVFRKFDLDDSFDLDEFDKLLKEEEQKIRKPSKNPTRTNNAGLVGPKPKERSDSPDLTLPRPPVVPVNPLSYSGVNPIRRFDENDDDDFTLNFGFADKNRLGPPGQTNVRLSGPPLNPVSSKAKIDEFDTNLPAPMGGKGPSGLSSMTNGNAQFLIKKQQLSKQSEPMGSSALQGLNNMYLKPYAGIPPLGAPSNPQISNPQDTFIGRYKGSNF